MVKAKTVVVGKLVRVCPGKNHAWFESPVGLIRKPYVVPEPKGK